MWLTLVNMGKHMAIALFVFGGIIVGLFTAEVAEEKGYGRWGWLALGFFFSIIALIAACGLPDKKKR